MFGALNAAADLSKILGKSDNEIQFRQAAREIQQAILLHLWDEKSGLFVNMINRTGSDIITDGTIDISSVYGISSFGVLPKSDARLARAWEVSVKRLSEGISAGGIARFENDDYYRIPGPSMGNPWVLTTLWYAEYLIDNAGNARDLDRAKEIFSWVVRHAQPSGVLSEQLNPQTGEQVCAAPLTWAHAAYVSAVLKYIEKSKELSEK